VRTCSGEAGIVPQCGKQWSEAAGLLCELLATLPPSVSHPPQQPASPAAPAAARVSAAAAQTAADGGSRPAAAAAAGLGDAASGGGTEAAAHLQPWPAFAAAVQAAWRQLLALASPCPETGAVPNEAQSSSAAAAGNADVGATANMNAATDAASLRDAEQPPSSKRSRVGGGGQPAVATSTLGAVLRRAGAQAGLQAEPCTSAPTSDNAAGAFKTASPGRGTEAVLAAAAAHCMAQAAAHLRVGLSSPSAWP